jgi:hypothetical protein
LTIFPLLALTMVSVASLGAANAQTSISSVTVNSADQNGNALTGDYYVVTGAAFYGPVYGLSNVVTAGMTNSTFATQAGSTYTLQLYGYGNCTFTHWSNGATNNTMSFTATSGALKLTAVYFCVGSIFHAPVPVPQTGKITIYDHRVPQSDWAPCFALACDLGTGPGASMFVTLYNSAGTIVGSGFSNENGYTFTGLNASATYFIYPADCALCHGSTHDVDFSHWSDGSTTRPLVVSGNGTSVNAWYICTNTCGGV